MYRDERNDTWYKVGLHIHTTLSDGWKTPSEAAQIYRDAGYDAIAVTDHWCYTPGGSTEGLTVLAGCEYNIGGGDTSGLVMHIVGVGMRKAPVVERTASPQEIIDAITQAGGLAVLAHPAWSLNTKEQILPLCGFSMMEIYNSVSDVEQSARPYSGYIADVLANAGMYLPLSATDDVHYYKEDATKSYVWVRAEDGSAEGLLAALAAGDFYASQGPRLSIRREGRTLHVSCSEATFIAFFSNSAWESDHILRGEGLTHGSYTARSYEKWVRVEVRDKDGNMAWSQFYDMRGEEHV